MRAPRWSPRKRSDFRSFEHWTVPAVEGTLSLSLCHHSGAFASRSGKQLRDRAANNWYSAKAANMLVREGSQI